MDEKKVPFDRHRSGERVTDLARLCAGMRVAWVSAGSKKRYEGSVTGVVRDLGVAYARFDYDKKFSHTIRLTSPWCDGTEGWLEVT